MKSIKKCRTLVGWVLFALVALAGCDRCKNNDNEAGPGDIPKPGDEQVAIHGGIPNRGNTCYMNAVLQVLVRLYPTVRFNDAALNTAWDGLKAKIANNQANASEDDAKNIWAAIRGACTAMNLQLGRQEDAAELLLALEEQQANDVIAPSITTPNHLPFVRGVTNMQAHLNGYLNTLKPDVTQPSVAAATEGAILQLPLGRFTDAGAKINDDVQQALTLEIDQAYTAGRGTLKYELVAFIEHIGSTAKSGHYVAYIKDGQQWYLYNDSSVTKVLKETVIAESCQSYIYFYRAKS